MHSYLRSGAVVGPLNWRYTIPGGIPATLRFIGELNPFIPLIAIIVACESLDRLRNDPQAAATTAG